jgi:hypothetical protein
VRRAVAWAALWLALPVLAALSVVVWLDRQALDTGNWTAASRPLLREAPVRDAVAAALVDALARSQGVGPAASNAFRARAEPAVARLLETEGAVALWAAANRDAHAALLRALDRPDGEDAVIIDLRPLAARVAQPLRLEAAPPAGAAEVVVVPAGRLEPVRRAADVLRPAVTWLALALAALLAVAFALGGGARRRMLVALGIGAAAVGVALLLGRPRAGEAIVDHLADPQYRDAGTAAWDAFSAMLSGTAIGLVAGGAALAVVAAFAGRARPRARSGRLHGTRRRRGGFRWT